MTWPQHQQHSFELFGPIPDSVVGGFDSVSFLQRAARILKSDESIGFKFIFKLFHHLRGDAFAPAFRSPTRVFLPDGLQPPITDVSGQLENLGG